MKNLVITLVVLLLCSQTFAQAPNAFNYQAVLRDSNNEVLVDKNVSLRINIVKGSESGDPVFTEIFLKNSGKNGLINLVIGEGNIILGSIGEIDWGIDSYFLQVDVDSEGGSDYVNLGESKLLSVPYALYAASSGETATVPNLSVTYETIKPTCYGNTDGSILLSVIGGRTPYSIEWSNGSTSNSLENVPAGSYTVTITENNGQFINRIINLLEPQPVTISFNKQDITCNGLTDGQINANVYGGNGAFTYIWNNGESTRDIINLTAGTYSLTATDQLGCTNQNEVSIQEPSTISIQSTITNVKCFGENTGAITLEVTGGTVPYLYSSDHGVVTSIPTFSDLEAGDYEITVMDKNTCNIKNTYTIIPESPEIIVNANITDMDCKGDSSGSIVLDVSGGVSPYTYSWSNAETTKDITDLPGGSYTVLVSDNEECNTNKTFSVFEPTTILEATYTVSDEFKNESDGAIDLSMSGGSTPYQYSWDEGSTSEDLINISAGTYSVTISDNYGCKISTAINVENIESVTDVGGNVYDIVKINDQIWMAENLKSTKFTDGWIITDIKYPGNDINNVEVYGILYTIYAVRSGKICPEGWKMPNNTNWDELIAYLNGNTLAGGSMKETGTTTWKDPNTGATNQSGFSARGAGYSGNSLLEIANFWSDPNYYFVLRYGSPVIDVNSSNSGYNSIRCIKETW